MTANPEFGLTFNYIHPANNLEEKLPINDQTKTNPQFTVGILNSAFYDNSQTAKFPFSSVARAHKNVLEHIGTFKRDRYECRLSFEQLMQKTPQQLRDMGLGEEDIEILNSAVMPMRDRQ